VIEPEARVENRENGRYRLNEEDKARPVPLKLHQKYIDRLEWLPGKNVAEKIRNIIDTQTELLQREGRQIEEVRKLIGPLYRRARELTSPELRENKTKYENAKLDFLKGLKSFETLIDLYHFSFETLKKSLSERDFIELQIIFSSKSYFKTN